MKIVVVFFLLFGLINFALGDSFDYLEYENPCEGRIELLTESGARKR